VNRDLTEGTKLRKEEKAENAETLVKAKDGLEAVAEALMILKNFYSKAESLLQASPVDEDTSGPGFAGPYKGKIEASKGVLGILEVIKSDFARTIRTTNASESKAAADFVEFDRASKADIAGKETKKLLDEQDLKTTKADIEQTTSDLQGAMKLLDDAVKTLEALQPTCVDTGMSYEERKEKRQAEMKALIDGGPLELGRGEPQTLSSIYEEKGIAANGVEANGIEARGFEEEVFEEKGKQEKCIYEEEGIEAYGIEAKGIDEKDFKVKGFEGGEGCFAMEARRQKEADTNDEENDCWDN